MHLTDDLYADKLWDGLTRQAYAHLSDLTAITDETSFPGRSLLGHTTFFRNPIAYKAYLDRAQALHDAGQPKVEILSVGGSVGAEAHSLAYDAVKRNMHPWLKITTLDLSPRFTRIAVEGIYPQGMFARVQPERPGFTKPFGKKYVRVRDQFRFCVKARACKPLQLMATDQPHADIVILDNMLMYVDRQNSLVEGLRAAASMARHAVGIYSAYNPRLENALNNTNLKPGGNSSQFTNSHIWNKMAVQKQPLFAFK